MTTVSQRTFASGEISPSLYARVNLVKYATGLRTCKNSLILRYGGAANRPGTEFICEIADSTENARLIEFIFNNAQTYVLEFGNLYMRVIKDGVLQTSTATGGAITGISQADPCQLTITGHGLSVDDEVIVRDVVGMEELNDRQFLVNSVIDSNNITLKLKDIGATTVDTTNYTAYISGGTCYPVYEITTPYSDSEVFDIDFVQSADVVSLAHPSHAPRELSRTGDTSWTLSESTFAPTVSFPTGVSSARGPSGSKTFRYKVTAIDEETGEESLPGKTSSAGTITGITNADPAVVTVTSHGYANDEEIIIEGVVGMEELNGRTFVVDNVTTNTFELVGEDSTAYGAYSSGGTSTPIFTKLTSAGTPTTGSPHVISWTKVDNAIEYNIYKEINGVYGQIGVASGTSFNDININPNTSFTPPTSRNPFIGTGNYPSTVTYIQQRKAYANTNNNTEKIFLSRTGNFNNFTFSSPTQSDDAITFTLAGRQVNEVNHIIDLGRLVILTSGGEWSATGNEAGIITPTAINAKQYSYNGSGTLKPIIIDGSAIYQQARGSIIRDLAYSQDVEGYAGNDLTIFSAHLFDKFTLVDWTYQQIPHSIVWCARSDGTLLGMTFVRNQDVIAWHQHTIGNLVESITTVPEGNEDSVYMVVSRTINGETRKYIEKFSSRLINDVEDMKFMDAHKTYDGTNTTSITMTLSGGTNWTYDEDLTLTASASFFTSGDVGNAIHLQDPSDGSVLRCTIKSYSSGTAVTINPHKTVSITLRNVTVTAWTKAIAEVVGLDHLEGEDVAVFADKFVVASPNNAQYDTATVTNGKVTLDKPYGVIHIGIPYISDIETLDIDTEQGETLANKKKAIGEVTLFVEESRGIFVGPKPPTSDTLNPLEDLYEIKIRNSEGYDDPVALKTDNVEVIIKPEWNSNGRVFLRQVDPVPMTILSIHPSGYIPFRG